MDPLSIVTKNIPIALVAQAYNEQLQAVGGVPPYTWSLDSGALPSGVSLSPSGILDAAASSILASDIGVHALVLKVTDSAGTPISATTPVTMEVAPYGYDRVVEFLIDTRFRSLLNRYNLDNVTRNKVERHFFRALMGVEGDTLVHMDRDILCEDWPTLGIDHNLREVLELIDTSASDAIKTINSVAPDLTTNDFGITGSAGVTITPVVNGIEIGVIDTQKVERYTAVGSIAPGGNLDLQLQERPAIFSALVETDTDIWYPVADIPSFAGKKMGQGIVSTSGGVLAHAVGNRGPTPLVHVLWEDPVTPAINVSRFHGETLAHEETISFGLPSPVVGYPLVMVGINGQVIISWCDGNSDFWHGVLNPANYTDTTPPTYLNPPVLTPALNPINPTSVTGRIIGAVPRAGSPAAGLCYIVLEQGASPVVIEVDTLTAGPGGGYTGTLALGPAGAMFWDVVADSVSDILLILGVDGYGGPADNLCLWGVTTNPFPAGALPAPAILDGPVADGAYFEDMMMSLGDSPSGSPVRAVTAAYVVNDYSVLPGHGFLKVAWQDATETWPVVPAPVVTSVARAKSTDAVNSVFVREWDSGGGDECSTYLLDIYAVDSDTVLRRMMIAPNIGVVEGETVIAHYNSLPLWMGAAHVSETTTGAWKPRVLTSDDLFLSMEGIFSPEHFEAYYDAANTKVVFKNNSEFQWTVQVEALVHTGGTDLPPNLMIQCFQLAQALRNFYDDASFFPSPSASGGVTWTEAQLAASNTGGFLFSNYYSVVPGSYDMYGGTVAQAFYYSDEAAGLASDQIVVFRYNYMPSEIAVAELIIEAAIIANLPITPPSAGGAANPNYYTLAELDAKLGTTFATTYIGPPFDYYRYFCFLDTTGAFYHHGWFSQNVIDTALSYGPYPTTQPTIPVEERFTVSADAVTGVPTSIILSHAVATANVYVNGIRYARGLDWIFGASMNEILYLNRAGTIQNPGYTLHQYDEAMIDKYLL